MCRWFKSTFGHKFAIVFMHLIKKLPITNGLRHQIMLQKNLLTKTGRMVKFLNFGQKQKSGRNCSGKITIRHRGGGCKRLYRKINQTSFGFISITVSIFYDPNRNSFISLNYDFVQHHFFYTLATDFVSVGSVVACLNINMDLRLGFRLPLKHIPTGSLIHLISKCSLLKTQYIKAAGSCGQLIQKGQTSCKIRLPSGTMLSLSVNNFATIGVSSNSPFSLTCIGNAGKNRLKGWRPKVRGVAMNPVDHPHGGRTNGGRPCVTPWGIPTRGKPTKRKNI